MQYLKVQRLWYDTTWFDLEPEQLETIKLAGEAMMFECGTADFAIGMIARERLSWMLKKVFDENWEKSSDDHPKRFVPSFKFMQQPQFNTTIRQLENNFFITIYLWKAFAFVLAFPDIVSDSTIETQSWLFSFCMNCGASDSCVSCYKTDNRLIFPKPVFCNAYRNENYTRVL